jgi:hypothetical protein
MHKIIKLLCALALAVAGSAYADPPGRVARLNYLSGPVSIAPADAPGDWVQAIVNRPLTGGDRLWADRGSRAEFHVGSTAVRLAAHTNLDVLYLDDDRIQLRLGEGTANVRVRELDPEDIVEIATPAGAVLLRQPGSYRITTDPGSDAVRISVAFGQAEVVTPVRTFVVPSGQAAVLPAGRPPAFEIAHGAVDEFDQWSAERDRREDRVASTRYVSSHMTGYEDLDHHGTWSTVPDYGAVWIPARVAPGWAPYRHGHWAWISPWGWTWVDDAPWGFAPFHYGRWVHVHDRWAWAPGPIVRRPVYAPALVAFVGGSGWSVSVGGGPAVGWFPLGWREPYRPWYRASSRHVHNVNVTHVTNVTNVYNTNVRHVHRHRPEAVTVVPQQAFANARPVREARVNVAQAELARAQLNEKPPAEPTRASIAPERRGPRPPAQVTTREVVTVTAPATAAPGPSAGSNERPARFRRDSDDDERPRTRVVERDGDRERDRQRVEARRAQQQQAQPAPAAAASARVVTPVAPPAAAAPVFIPESRRERREQEQLLEERRAEERRAEVLRQQRRDDRRDDRAEGRRMQPQPQATAPVPLQRPPQPAAQPQAPAPAAAPQRNSHPQAQPQQPAAAQRQAPQRAQPQQPHQQPQRPAQREGRATPSGAPAAS